MEKIPDNKKIKRTKSSKFYIQFIVVKFKISYIQISFMGCVADFYNTNSNFTFGSFFKH